MNKNKLKLMDALLVWGICFLLFGIVGELLAPWIGIWAYYLCQIAAAVVVLTLAHKTGFVTKKLLAPGGQSMGQTVGAALVWVGCLLAAIPFLLFSQLIVPGFAVTAFHIYDYTSSHAAVAGIILLSALSESLLFDCFLFPRLKGMGKERPWLPYLLIGILGGLYHADLYILFPMALLSAGIAYVRSRSGGFTLPLILRLLSILITTAYLQVSDAGEALLGVSMGLTQVCGFGLILFGAAFPAVACGARLLGGFKDRSMLEKFLVIVVSVVLIAAGCGISAL